MRVWWRFCEDDDFVTSSRVPICEIGHVKSTCWNLKSLWQAGFRESFVTQAKSQVTHKTLCLFSYLYQYYINSHYPRNVRRTRSVHKKLFREKTLAKHLRVRDCLPTILNIISLEFPFTLTSLSTHPWEVFSLNTYLTHFEYWEKFWCLWEALEEAIEWRMQLGGIARSR